MMLSISVNSAHNNNKYAITYMSAGVMNRENMIVFGPDLQKMWGHCILIV